MAYREHVIAAADGTALYARDYGEGSGLTPADARVLRCHPLRR